MGTYKTDVKYEITPDIEEKLEYMRNYYVRTLSEEEKKKYFNGLTKMTYVRNAVKGYTAINRIKARVKYADTPYDLMYNYKFDDVVYNYIKKKDKVYLTTAIRAFGLRRYRIVCGYNPKYVFNILDKYDVHDYYDFSCGWGERLLSSVGRHINYYGTDPNKDLCDNLNTMVDDYRKYSGDTTTTVDIRCQGSEQYVSDWTGKMDLCFSSPPYFDLEVYEENNYKQSTHNRSFEQWIDEYIRPTVRNCHKYLKDDGHLVINITNGTYYDNLEAPVDEAVQQEGFKFVEKMSHRQTNVIRTKDKKQKNEMFYIYEKI